MLLLFLLTLPSSREQSFLHILFENNDILRLLNNIYQMWNVIIVEIHIFMLSLFM